MQLNCCLDGSHWPTVRQGGLASQIGRGAPPLSRASPAEQPQTTACQRRHGIRSCSVCAVRDSCDVSTCCHCSRLQPTSCPPSGTHMASHAALPCDYLATGQVRRSAASGVCAAAGARGGGPSTGPEDGDGPSLADYLEFGAQQDGACCALSTASASASSCLTKGACEADQLQQGFTSVLKALLREQPVGADQGLLGAQCHGCEHHVLLAPQGGCWGRSPTMSSAACRRLASWRRRTSGRSSTCRGENCAPACPWR
jgi:hypothetical protein